MKIILKTALLGLAVLAAGCAMPAESHGGHQQSGALDTGAIKPGGTATVRFAEAGTLAMHCHPHAFMEQTVTVASDGAEEVHVHILDGDDVGEYRFEPASVEVAVGGKVTYHNHGALMHTATEK